VSGVGVSLRPEPSSVRDARRYVDDRLSSLGFATAVIAAELLVSELVTNAILHARTPVQLSVEQRGESVRVNVGDDSRRTPRTRHHSVDSGTGRGLLLVERMSTRWGVETTATGKVVWFELPREPVDDMDGWGDDWEV
jgi:anti-sigma regulatory factor (Ser/Thr protein kinase)